MAKIDCLIFGYRKVLLKGEDISRVVSLLFSRRIFSQVTGELEITVRERDVDRVKRVLSDRFEYKMSEPLGLLGRVKCMRHKAAILAGAAICLALCLFSYNTVWDIRVEGNEKIPDSAVIYELSRCGLKAGDRWSILNFGEIENEMLASVDRLSWININRRGSVAYVKIIEKGGSESTDEPTNSGYANLVAECDAVIEEITVRRGVAAVGKGDVVRAGDVLIYGILPEESGGGYCYAEGTVIGIVSSTVDTEVEKNYELKEKTDEKTVEMCVKFFDFSLNLFKKYGNSYKDCDIIVENSSFSLFGKCKLPIEIKRSIAAEYNIIDAVYTDTELVDTCSARHMAQLAYLLSDADLLKIRTDGEYTDVGYKMHTALTYSTDIGAEKPFYVN